LEEDTYKYILDTIGDSGGCSGVEEAS
jgi:hypothetical protein